MRGIIGSSLEKFRESIRSPFIDGEKFVGRTQASFDGGNLMHASWKPGFLYLTPTRVLFYQGDSQVFEIPLSSIKGIEIVTARWVSKKTCEQLELRKETEKGIRIIRLRIEALERWKGLIEERCWVSKKTCQQLTLHKEWLAPAAGRRRRADPGQEMVKPSE